MSVYNEQLSLLRQQIERKGHVEAVLKELREAESDLECKVAAFAIEKKSEEQDVERLSGHSLLAFFYAVTGRKDEKLEKEKKEALEAAVRYECACKELLDVKKTIEAYEKEHLKIYRAPKEYERLLLSKREEIKESATAKASEIITLEEKIAVLKNQNKELGEAISEGKKALDIAWQLYSELDRAEALASHDIFWGKGMTSFVKYEYVDAAQALTEKLQIQLRRFKAELCDVEINADVKIEISEFDRFADCFFDNIFTDWFVSDKLRNARNQAENARKELDKVIEMLSGRHTKVKTQLERAEEKIRELVMNTEI